MNHAYAFGGASLAMDTVENYLNIPINHYVSINMAGLKELVNAVGGIEVNNNLTFLKTDMILRLVKFHWMVNKHSPIQECVTKTLMVTTAAKNVKKSD